MKAQGNISIKRLRTGETLTLSLQPNKAIFQLVDDSGNVKPNWKETANQPTITPKIAASSGAAYNIIASSIKWFWDGVELEFGNDSNTPIDTNGKFQINRTTGALTIVDNIASSVNNWNDTLTFKCSCVVNGITYGLEKSIDIEIMPMSSNTYKGLIIADKIQLDSENPTATLNTSLYIGGELSSEYYVKWDNGKTGKSITINRDDINGVTMVLAEFYSDAGFTKLVERAGITITDILDNYQIVPVITSANKMVSTGNPVTVKGNILDVKNGQVLDISSISPSWNVEILRGENMDTVRTATTQEVTITTSDTDVNGEYNDVEVLYEVSW